MAMVDVDKISSSWLAWFKAWRPPSAVLRLLSESGELWQWLSHGDSTINSAISVLSLYCYCLPLWFTSRPNNTEDFACSSCLLMMIIWRDPKQCLAQSNILCHSGWPLIWNSRKNWKNQRIEKEVRKFSESCGYRGTVYFRENGEFLMQRRLRDDRSFPTS